MPGTSVTSLGLHLGDDALQNENWEKINQALAQLGVKQIIPEDLLVQGNLTVQGTGSFSGAIDTPALSAGTGTFTGDITSAIVHATDLDVPAGALEGALLAADASVIGVWVGTAVTGVTSLTSTPAQLATLATPGELANRWTILLAQLTYQISWGAQAPLITVTTELRRGTTTAVYTRPLQYASSEVVQGLDIDIPVSLIRVARPGDTVNTWTVWGSATYQNAVGSAWKFAQLSAIQLR